MMYTAEQVKRIEKISKAIHSTKETEVSLCQYKGLSCVRCCLPHIGGDSPHEFSTEKIIGLENKDNSLKYKNRYVSKGLLMKFMDFHPRVRPGFEVSHFEDSFQDEGKKTIEKHFSRRRKLFLEMFNPDKPDSSILKYEKKIKREEGYRYKPEGRDGFYVLFFGGSFPRENCKKGEAAECHLLGFLDKEEKRAGCLAHPLSQNTQGYDGRAKAGFFSNDSCSRCSCEWGKEFRYLSDSARKVFDKATEGMSWYEYSRHGTAVLVAYLRSYDYVIQMLDKRGKLDKLSLENLVEFTNNLFDNWPLKKHQCEFKYKLDQMGISKFPVENKTIGQGTFEWFTGTGEQLIVLNKLRKKKYTTSVGSAEVIHKIPYKITTTKHGYLFEMRLGEEKKKIEIIVARGNKPSFKREQLKELWRLGVNYMRKCDNNPFVAAKCRLMSLIGQLNYDTDVIDYEEILVSQNYPPIKERIMYYAFDSLFFKEYFDRQVAQARGYIEKEVERV